MEDQPTEFVVWCFVHTYTNRHIFTMKVNKSRVLVDWFPFLLCSPWSTCLGSLVSYCLIWVENNWQANACISFPFSCVSFLYCIFPVLVMLSRLYRLPSCSCVRCVMNVFSLRLVSLFRPPVNFVVESNVIHHGQQLDGGRVGYMYVWSQIHRGPYSDTLYSLIITTFQRL